MSTSTLDRIIGKDDVVAVVGYGGMVPRMAGRCRELHVTDIRPRESFQTTVVGQTISYEPHDIYVHGADENERVLSRADVVLITASTLVNETFGEVVGYCRNCRAVGLYGPSGMLLPETLFREGIDFVQSVRISDPGSSSGTSSTIPKWRRRLRSTSAGTQHISRGRAD